ncbi:MAG: DUF488 family protein [Terriglobia bacterium]
MASTLFTIGFTKKTAEEFFGLLQTAGVRKVVDIRENPGGQLSGFAKYPDLSFFLHRLIGAEYIREPLLAPSPEIRAAYKRTRDWEQYELSFLALMKERGVPECIDPAGFEGSVALLCSEGSPEKCHRRLVAELFAAHWSRLGDRVEVKHLGIERPSGGGRRKKAVGSRQSAVSSSQ